MFETVTPLLSPTPPPTPTSTATPVPFSAAAITGFAPVGTTPVYAHTLAKARFDLTTTTGMNDTDIERLSLRGATPVPEEEVEQGESEETPTAELPAGTPESEPNTEGVTNVQDEPVSPNSSLPIINLVRADPPAPRSISGQSSTIRLRPDGPTFSFPAEVWPLSTELTDTPALTLTLYVDEEPTEFSFQVTLQEQTVSGATEEQKTAQAGDFIPQMVADKPAAFLWQTPEQVDKVVIEGGNAVVVNDDRVYILAATATHYQVWVMTAQDRSSQGQAGWIKREYIDGGEGIGDR